MDPKSYGCVPNTKVFYSNDENATANFATKTSYFLNMNRDFCYDAFVVKTFDKLEEAEKYISLKRPDYPVKYSENDIGVTTRGQTVRNRLNDEKVVAKFNINSDDEISEHELDESTESLLPNVDQDATEQIDDEPDTIGSGNGKNVSEAGGTSTDMDNLVRTFTVQFKLVTRCVY